MLKSLPFSIFSVPTESSPSDRGMLLENIARLAVITGIPAAGFLLWRMIPAPSQFIGGLIAGGIFVLLAAITFAQRKPWSIRIWSIGLTALAVSILALYNNAFAGDVRLYSLSLPMILLLLTSRKHLLLNAALGTISFAAYAGLSAAIVCNVWLNIRDAILELDWWIESGATNLVLSGLTIALLYSFDGYRRALQREMNAARPDLKSAK